MSREMPFECPHGVMLGGHESHGYSDNTCDACEDLRWQADRRYVQNRMGQDLMDLNEGIKRLTEEMESFNAVLKRMVRRNL
jgi:hypothetical protein